MVLQINSFQEGGVAIGVSCSHMMADLTFIASFVKSWTEFHRHFPITHPPLIAPLSTGRHASSSSTKTSSATATATNFATATFKFSGSTMKQCLSKVHDWCPNATPFDFLAALFWTRVARVRPPKTQDQTHSLCICSDFRSLLKPPLPIGYLGNALKFSTLSQKVKDVELGGVVSAVHKHLEELSEEASNEGKRVYGSELTCVCMEHLMVEEDQESLLYGAVFGNNEKPVHVSCRVGNVESEGLIMVMPCSEGGLSRSVTVMLAEEEVAELNKDEAIMELEPVMVLAGCEMEH